MQTYANDKVRETRKVDRCYAYLAASWGGYIFVNNLIGIHALLLVFLGRFNTSVYRAYTLYFVIGTTKHRNPRSFAIEAGECASHI